MKAGSEEQGKLGRQAGGRGAGKGRGALAVSAGLRRRAPALNLRGTAAYMPCSCINAQHSTAASTHRRCR